MQPFLPTSRSAVGILKTAGILRFSSPHVSTFILVAPWQTFRMWRESTPLTTPAHLQLARFETGSLTYELPAGTVGECTDGVNTIRLRVLSFHPSTMPGTST